MNISDAVKFLIENGYKEYPSHKNNYIHRCFSKRVESKSVCDLNDKLSIFVEIGLFKIIDVHTHETCKIEIRAEKENKWWTLNCYSLKFDELKDNLNKVELKLIELFNVIGGTQ